MYGTGSKIKFLLNHLTHQKVKLFYDIMTAALSLHEQERPKLKLTILFKLYCFFAEKTSQYDFNYPIGIYNGNEDYQYLGKTLKPILQSMQRLQEQG